MNHHDVPRSIEQAADRVEINARHWVLHGWSRAGCQTGFALSPLRVLFDCGLASAHNYDHVFVTHQHTDHTQNLTNICNRHKPGRNNVYAPAASIKYLIKLVRAMAELSDPANESLSDEELLRHETITFHGVEPGDVIRLPEEGVEVEVLQAYHDCACVGFGVRSYHKVVLPEYRHLLEEPSGDERAQLCASEVKQLRAHRIEVLKQLRARGVEMYDTEARPEFCFFCDSDIRNLRDHTEWQRYPLLVVECTGLAGNSGARDFDRNHTSISTLLPIMLAHADKRWVLIHVSATLALDEIEAIERDLLDRGLDVFVFKR